MPVPLLQVWFERKENLDRLRDGTGVVEWFYYVSQPLNNSYA